MWYSCIVGFGDLDLMKLTLDNLLLMWYDCLIGSVAYWLRPSSYKAVNRVQFSAEPLDSFMSLILPELAQRKRQAT